MSSSMPYVVVRMVRGNNPKPVGLPTNHACYLHLDQSRLCSTRSVVLFQLMFPLFRAYTLPVFRPRTIDSEPALYEAAIKILSRRAHSVSDMKKALIRRTSDEDLIKKV